uniref:Uncharacterized protein n=1 Tax=Chromera velia CCMP2878 TaxID=1169474 RepID=A0A0G4IBV5_9ALVE|eukprot:Cvel_12911.t1-p1 / transcript=Cvel_12911.t1 / gene=Cvel_12911 / organism=Chromera_velia_CCMP2878 / gene_product=Scavenger receptor class F member 1, putative / transcript_product=Scavenger receptor class F member 1, putative / location=Cvel_scaffold863:5050-14249(+) / protein_length=1865 / sequence_SO=supercontig / SO=protein_coding / is_pseudo=false
MRNCELCKQANGRTECRVCRRRATLQAPLLGGRNCDEPINIHPVQIPTRIGGLVYPPLVVPCIRSDDRGECAEFQMHRCKVLGNNRRPAGSLGRCVYGCEDGFFPHTHLCLRTCPDPEAKECNQMGISVSCKKPDWGIPPNSRDGRCSPCPGCAHGCDHHTKICHRPPQGRGQKCNIGSVPVTQKMVEDNQFAFNNVFQAGGRPYQAVNLWGPSCFNVCSLRCNGKCHEDTGGCQCVANYYTPNGGAPCSAACPYCNHGCISGGPPIAGAMMVGGGQPQGPPGLCFPDPSRRPNTMCGTGIDARGQRFYTWGPYCNQACPPGCVGKCDEGTRKCLGVPNPETKKCDGDVDPKTGQCAACKRGFFGPWCEQQCSTAGIECYKDACVLDHQTSFLRCILCAPQCKTHGKGAQCNEDGSCAVCNPGFYGKYCEYECACRNKGADPNICPTDWDRFPNRRPAIGYFYGNGNAFVPLPQLQIGGVAPGSGKGGVVLPGNAGELPVGGVAEPGRGMGQVILGGPLEPGKGFVHMQVGGPSYRVTCTGQKCPQALVPFITGRPVGGGGQGGEGQCPFFRKLDDTKKVVGPAGEVQFEYAGPGTGVDPSGWGQTDLTCTEYPKIDDVEAEGATIDVNGKGQEACPFCLTPEFSANVPRWALGPGNQLPTGKGFFVAPGVNGVFYPQVFGQEVQKPSADMQKLFSAGAAARLSCSGIGCPPLAVGCLPWEPDCRYKRVRRETRGEKGEVVIYLESEARPDGTAAQDEIMFLCEGSADGVECPIGVRACWTLQQCRSPGMPGPPGVMLPGPNGPVQVGGHGAGGVILGDGSISPGTGDVIVPNMMRPGAGGVVLGGVGEMSPQGNFPQGGAGGMVSPGGMPQTGGMGYPPSTGNGGTVLVGTGPYGGWIGGHGFGGTPHQGMGVPTGKGTLVLGALPENMQKPLSRRQDLIHVLPLGQFVNLNAKLGGNGMGSGEVKLLPSISKNRVLVCRSNAECPKRLIECTGGGNCDFAPMDRNPEDPCVYAPAADLGAERNPYVVIELYGERNCPVGYNRKRGEGENMFPVNVRTPSDKPGFYFYLPRPNMPHIEGDGGQLLIPGETFYPNVAFVDVSGTPGKCPEGLNICPFNRPCSFPLKAGGKGKGTGQQAPAGVGVVNVYAPEKGGAAGDKHEGCEVQCVGVHCPHGVEPCYGGADECGFVTLTPQDSGGAVKTGKGAVVLSPFALWTEQPAPKDHLQMFPMVYCTGHGCPKGAGVCDPDKDGGGGCFGRAGDPEVSPDGKAVKVTFGNPQTGQGFVCLSKSRASPHPKTGQGDDCAPGYAICTGGDCALPVGVGANLPAAGMGVVYLPPQDSVVWCTGRLCPQPGFFVPCEVGDKDCPFDRDTPVQVMPQGEIRDQALPVSYTPAGIDGTPDVVYRCVGACPYGIRPVADLGDTEFFKKAGAGMMQIPTAPGMGYFGYNKLPKRNQIDVYGPTPQSDGLWFGYALPDQPQWPEKKCEGPECGRCLVCEQMNGVPTECEKGFWGPFCRSPCPKECEGDGKCDVNTGFCKCKPGSFWHQAVVGTPQCSPCPENCAEGCNADGMCKGGCDGERFFGRFCENPCPFNCGSRQCDQKGFCTSSKCSDNRFWGPQCSYPCSVGCPEGTCQKENGHCALLGTDGQMRAYGCRAGRNGEPGWHGLACDKRCDPFCKSCVGPKEDQCTLCHDSHAAIVRDPSKPASCRMCIGGGLQVPQYDDMCMCDSRGPFPKKMKADGTDPEVFLWFEKVQGMALKKWKWCIMTCAKGYVETFDQAGPVCSKVETSLVGPASASTTESKSKPSVAFLQTGTSKTKRIRSHRNTSTVGGGSLSLALLEEGQLEETELEMCQRQLSLLEEKVNQQ